MRCPRSTVHARLVLVCAILGACDRDRPASNQQPPDSAPVERAVATDSTSVSAEPRDSVAELVTLTPRRGSDELGFVLARGRRVDIEQYPHTTELILVEAPYEGTCVSGTHGVCGARYYLVYVAEEGSTYAFDLGGVGKMDSVTRFPTVDPFAGELQVRVTAYPADIYEVAPAAARAERWYRIWVRYDSLLIRADTSRQPPPG